MLASARTVALCCGMALESHGMHVRPGSATCSAVRHHPPAAFWVWTMMQLCQTSGVDKLTRAGKNPVGYDLIQQDVVV